MKYTTVPKQKSREERGSILIFVVGVLVLLALSATAYLATARVDRVTTKQNEYNTQVDLLLEGCRQIAIGAILADETVISDVRKTSTGDPAAGSYFADGPGVDHWIGSRVPVSYGGNPADARKVWRYLSQDVVKGQPFETPTGGSYTTRDNAIPTNIGSSPALQFSVGGTKYYAADSDGDGIADAGLIRLPLTQINGVTYYVGYRIVDHSSAVNAATAMSRDNDIDSSGATPLPATGYLAKPTGFFTTGVGLLEMLRGSSTAEVQTQFNALRDYRLGVPPYADVTTSGASPAAYGKYRSFGDKFFHDVSRRRNDPASVNYRTFGLTDQIALSSRFTLRDPTLQTDVEQRLDKSLFYTALRSRPYDANNTAQWFTDFFNYETETYGDPSTFKPLRALLTTRNDQPALVRGADLSSLKGSPTSLDLSHLLRTVSSNALTDMGERMTFYHPTDAEALEKSLRICSVNTADFPELWRAFYNVMCNPADSSLPDGDAIQLHRNWITNPNVSPQWGKTQQLLVRAAQAAVNLMDLRDVDDDITRREIKIFRNDGVLVDVIVSGTERQPYITKVVFQEDGSGAALYGAIELYNPYDVPITLNDGWALASLDRLTPTADPKITLIQQISAVPGGSKVVPAKGFLVIESSDSTATPIPNIIKSPTANSLVMSNLAQYKGQRDPANTIVTDLHYPRQFLLLRTRRADGVLTTTNDLRTPDTNELNFPEAMVDPSPTADANIGNLVVVDQVSSDGQPSNTTAGAVFYRSRPTPTYDASGNVDPALAGAWKFVYEPAVSVFPQVPAEWKAGPTVLGAPTPATEDLGATRPVIQLANMGWPSPTATLPPSTPGGPVQHMQYPYGGFARLGDLYKVPFIGSATILDLSGSTSYHPLLDVTSVARDAYYAQVDTASTDISAEHVGRFVSENASYAWAEDLFNYFTVIGHPADEYDLPLPATSYLNEYNAGPDTTVRTLLTKAGPVSGLININTAPFKVLAALPWVPAGANGLTFDAATGNLAAASGTDPNNRDDNEDIARAIVWYRDYGPGSPRTFNNVTELLGIPAMQTARTALLAAGDPDDAFGDTTPVNVSATPSGFDLDGARNDAEENTLILNRVSNLVTTRSDVYTVYIDLQGWRDAGTSAATLVVQRRAAMIVDRSAYTPETPTVSVTRVPIN